MKRFVKILIFTIIIIVMFVYRKPIFNYVYKNFIMNKEVIVEKANQYQVNQSFLFVKETDDFSPKNKKELINILYTIINRGWKNFTFYCSDEYKNCKEDITSLAGDQELLSNINNFSHPFNSYKSIAIGVDYFGRITTEISFVYTPEEINKINQKVELIFKQAIKPTMTEKQKIRVLHDYIINRVKYDQSKETYKDKNGNIYYKSKSNTAYGPLFNGVALCGGYTDLMALFLNKLQIPNFRVASENHVWNAVYIDSTWKHLDLTWDDPIVSTGENVLSYEFFLIDTKQLKKLDNSQHNFQLDVYQELK